MMKKREINLVGQFCPFPVMRIVRDVDLMRPGETLRFLVDDPLATKSVPEELEDYRDLSISITPRDRNWEIAISRE